jgi:nicotinate-nucleotide adenylyltransferase
VIWVPTYQSPHKLQTALAFEHRFAMVQRAIVDQPAFSLSAIDAQRTGPSYAIATLAALQPLHPNTDWHWIIGIDALQTLPRWRGAHELATRCTWLVAPRSRHTSTETDDAVLLSHSAVDTIAQCRQLVIEFARCSISLRWQLIPMPVIGISSSLIRQNCQQGASIRYLVPESVRSYIDEKKLYQIS